MVSSSDMKSPAVLRTAPAASAWPSHGPPTESPITGSVPVVHSFHGKAPLARAAPMGSSHIRPCANACTIAGALSLLP